MEKDRVKLTTFDAEAHLHIAAGVEIMRRAVGSTYGPGGRNVLTKKRYVQPVLTRDGVTVARELAGHGNRLKNQIAAEAAKLVYQASEKTNKTAGDGTTATVVLLSALYTAGRQRVVAGEDPMVVKRLLDQARETIVEFVESKSISCSQKMLRQVAEISSGDTALGQLISDLVWEVGADGAITINYHNAPFVEVEKVTGYLFNSGFRYLQTEVEFDEPTVVVAQRRIASRSDIIPLLNLLAANQRQFVIVADVSGAALETLMFAIQQQKVDGVVVPPPAFGQDGHEYFEDIAIYTGARILLESDNLKDVKLEDFGSVKRSRVSQNKAILFGDNTTGDAISERIAMIKKQLKSTDMTPSLQETLEQRHAKLAGKVSIIKVGAPTEVEREELFFRVEDAVEACKSALSSGVVAGGATTLLFASQPQPVKDAGRRDSGGMKVFSQPMRPELEPFIRDALRQPFGLLMSNAAEDSGYRKQQVLKAGYGKGFNLRSPSEEPIELIKSGIVDATRVVTQTVQNAFSVAAALLTTGTIITEDEEATDPAPVQA